MNQFSRLELLVKKENIERLKKLKIAVFGIGGVGSYVIEGLARSGVGNFVLVDSDIIDITNINRQILATIDTIGKDKVLVAKERILKINAEAKIVCYKEFYSKESTLSLAGCDYVVDAIDTVSSKIELIKSCNQHNIPIISSMGTGNKLDPTKLSVSDIYNTSVCPLCRVIRRELKKLDIKSLKVVYSQEEPLKPNFLLNNNSRPVIGSTAFVPAVAGLIIGNEVIKNFIK